MSCQVYGVPVSNATSDRAHRGLHGFVLVV